MLHFDSPPSPWRCRPARHLRGRGGKVGSPSAQTAVAVNIPAKFVCVHFAACDPVELNGDKPRLPPTSPGFPVGPLRSGIYRDSWAHFCGCTITLTFQKVATPLVGSVNS